ncbi:hypothetical protein BMETH_874_0 [methanotrophic bacterial endosymbiont of Bathymodiolus sp.]|nr:hypothetical protein BMETH_874_0 [methanotrophic bacterial endosymbiont of Bathymodiolus sp.]
MGHYRSRPEMHPGQGHCQLHFYERGRRSLYISRQISASLWSGGDCHGL